MKCQVYLHSFNLCACVCCTPIHNLVGSMCLIGCDLSAIKLISVEVWASNFHGHNYIFVMVHWTAQNCGQNWEKIYVCVCECENLSHACTHVVNLIAISGVYVHVFIIGVTWCKFDFGSAKCASFCYTFDECAWF